MTDEKEKFVGNILAKMHLHPEEQERLKNILWMELHEFSLVKIKNTDITVSEESLTNEALRMFFVSKNVQGCTKRTLVYYRNTLKQFFDFLGQKPIEQITTNDIRYWFAVKKERDGNKVTEINNKRRVLSSFFGWCYREEYLKKNPIAKIEKIRVEKRVKKPFKDMEIEKLRDGAKDDIRLTAILEVLLSTGCRISEVSGMNRDDLEVDEIVVYGKGKKERTVYLNAKARIALERYLNTRDDSNPAMFVSYQEPHSRLLVSGMGHDIRMLGRRCGVKDVHPHRFRRTSATFALNRGMPIEQVQLMLGHESIETTTLYAISAQEAVKANHKKYVV